jgi:hypothetical protein
MLLDLMTGMGKDDSSIMCAPDFVSVNAIVGSVDTATLSIYFPRQHFCLSLCADNGRLNMHIYLLRSWRMGNIPSISMVFR